MNRVPSNSLVIIVAFLAVVAATALYAHSSTPTGMILTLVDQEDALDLDDLTRRLADTKAIGLFTKLSLKKDVNKLEKDLRGYHAGDSRNSLDHIKERYDLMVHSVLVMVQEKDSQLADDIVAARDQLWDRLSDPDEFSKAVG